MASYDQLLNSLSQSQAMATSANLKRYDQAMKIYDTIIENYSPGGAFEKATLSQLSKQKRTDVGQEQQQLISGGLYGTTTAAATGRRWEESVGAPARLKLEDLQMQRLSEAQLGKAGFIERREDVGPDYSLLANLAQMGAGSGASSGGSTGGTSYGFGADASNRPGWGFDTYGTLGGTSGGTSGGSVTGTKPVAGIDWEAKRLADEAAAQKLKDAGKLTFGKTTPEEIKQATTKSSFEELYGGGGSPTYYANALEAQKAGVGSMYQGSGGTVYKINAKGQPVRQS